MDGKSTRSTLGCFGASLFQILAVNLYLAIPLAPCFVNGAPTQESVPYRHVLTLGFKGSDLMLWN